MHEYDKECCLKASVLHLRVGCYRAQRPCMSVMPVVTVMPEMPACSIGYNGAHAAEAIMVQMQLRQMHSAAEANGAHDY